MNQSESPNPVSGQTSGPASWTPTGVQLLLASFLVLFLELVLIRWVAAQVHVAAYFPNLILIAAFLGLGVGSLRAGSAFRWWFWPVALFLLAMVTIGLGRIAFTAEGLSEHLWLLYDDLPEDAPVIEGVRLPLVLLFALATLCFVPLGHYVGARLEAFRQGPGALVGYSLDLGGSFLGVVAFTIVGFSGIRPTFWFAACLLLGGILMARRRGLRWILVGAVAAIVLVGVRMTEKGDYFSPYYALTAERMNELGEHQVLTNGSRHQTALLLREDHPPAHEIGARARHGYTLPYTLLQRAPSKVLILGAGVGNDIAIALDTPADTIHAVEIDPVIRALGDQIHPNRPYQDPRVTAFVTDARSYLNQTDETYDLVIFGTLDSQTQLSALSSVRLDNFVYTVDGLRSAAERLRPGGGLVLYFMVSRGYISDHLTVMLTQVFGEAPRVYQGGWDLFNSIFLAGPAFSHLETDPGMASLEQSILEADIPVPNDDWPYLYLPNPGVTDFYWSVIGIFGFLTLLIVFGSSKELREELVGGSGVDWEMLLYGLGFLLMETRLVTAMNLAWGATWITSAVVFGSVLLMILAATLIMQWKPLSWRVAAGGLLLSLALTFLVPLASFTALGLAGRLGASMLYVGVPIFFAAACFAIRFRVRPNAATAFGWNLLGAVFGGLLEFLAMSLGLRAMILVALVAYALAVLFGRREIRVGPEQPAGPEPTPASP